MRLALHRRRQPVVARPRQQHVLQKIVDLPFGMVPRDARVYTGSHLATDETLEVSILVNQLLRHYAVVSVTLENTAEQLTLTVASHFELDDGWLDASLCCAGFYRKVPPMQRFAQLATAG